ncbi:MAG: hypothetical protein P4L87_23260 [Formivibrio sp.]|nr:hypothetical protein [Formivibrio sp.]
MSIHARQIGIPFFLHSELPHFPRAMFSMKSSPVTGVGGKASSKTQRPFGPATGSQKLPE